MQKFLRSFLITVVMLLPALSLNSAYGAPTNSVLKIGVTQEFDTLNPLLSRMLVSRYVYNMVSRSLVTLDENAEWIPLIVEKIPTFKNGNAKFITENGTKKIVANWKIRKNAKWGDGQPVTGHDVKFAWEVALHKFTSVGDKRIYSQIEEITVDKQNPKLFTFKYKQAGWDYYHIGAFAPLPSHLEAKAFHKHKNKKDGYNKQTLYSKDPTNPGLYSGPYRVVELKLGSHIRMAPNKHFFGKAPKIQSIVLKIIPNTSTLESNLRSGTIDMISTLGFSLDQALAFEKKAKAQGLPFKTKFKPSLTYEHIDLNLRNTVFQDKRVRKALVHAIDRDELTKALFEGRQKKAIHHMAPIDPWFTKDPKEVVLYKASKRKARKLLDAAGWKLNKKDNYRYKAGKKLSFSLMTTSGNKVRELVQVFLKNEWKKVGVDVSLKNEPARVYFGETIRKGTYPAMAMYAWISAPEQSPKNLFHSSQIPTAENGYTGNNSGGWKNSAVDKWIDELAIEFDASKRKKTIAKVVKAYTDEVPVIPLYYRSNVSVIPENLTGHGMSAHQFPATNFIENWAFTR